MNKKSKTAVKLSGIALGMFAFGFMLVPLYDVICEVTGLNGKTGTVTNDVVASMTVDESRTVTVELISNLNQSMRLDFAPQQNKIKVHPGASYAVNYIAHNRTNSRLVGQASPSVSPIGAAAYLDKIECFCFTEQVFEANETRTLPVRFIVSPKLPKNIKTVSLSYTFFDITHKT